MTNKEWMSNINKKLEELTNIVTPLITQMAVLQERLINIVEKHEQSRKTTNMRAVISSLATGIVSLILYMIKENYF